MQLYQVGSENEGPLSVEVVATLAEHDDLVSAVAVDRHEARTLATGSWDCG